MHFIKKYFILFLFISVSGNAAFAQKATVASQLQEGDIVFQKLPCGSLCDAIIETTPCLPGRAFNHCAIVHFENHKAYVIEAIGKAVKQTPLKDFLKRDTASILFVGRLKDKKTIAVNKAVTKAENYVGTPYDDEYLPGDKALYCSELVWECFRYKNDTPLFQLQPMTFKSPKTGTTYPGWTAYYNELHAAIPEGEPGINPCAIANSDKIKLIEINLK